MNSYGLLNLWYAGDGVIRGVAFFLLLMSFTSWCVILSKIWDAIHYRRLNERAFWMTNTFDSGLSALGSQRHNPFRQLAIAAQEATPTSSSKTTTLHDRLDTSTWLVRCLKNTTEDIQAKLESGLALLASIGATAPFVGLFGTVWGIYHALINISASGSSTIDKVAGPVGEALIMTALGLAVAIPAVLAYNGITRANKTLMTRLYRFAHDLHLYMIADGPDQNILSNKETQ